MAGAVRPHKIAAGDVCHGCAERYEPRAEFGDRVEALRETMLEARRHYQADDRC